MTTPIHDTETDQPTGDAGQDLPTGGQERPADPPPRSPMDAVREGRALVDNALAAVNGMPAAVATARQRVDQAESDLEAARDAHGDATESFAGARQDLHAAVDVAIEGLQELKAFIPLTD